jgi:hypothetical protein
MTATVVYKENGVEKEIEVEAVDEQTIRTTVNQWALNERRLRKVSIDILFILTDGQVQHGIIDVDAQLVQVDASTCQKWIDRKQPF